MDSLYFGCRVGDRTYVLHWAHHPLIHTSHTSPQRFWWEEQVSSVFLVLFSSFCPPCCLLESGNLLISFRGPLSWRWIYFNFLTSEVWQVGVEGSAGKAGFWIWLCNLAWLQASHVTPHLFTLVICIFTGQFSWITKKKAKNDAPLLDCYGNSK